MEKPSVILMLISKVIKIANIHISIHMITFATMNSIVVAVDIDVNVNQILVFLATSMLLLSLLSLPFS